MPEDGSVESSVVYSILGIPSADVMDSGYHSTLYLFYMLFVYEISDA